MLQGLHIQVHMQMPGVYISVVPWSYSEGSQPKYVLSCIEEPKINQELQMNM